LVGIGGDDWVCALATGETRKTTSKNGNKKRRIFFIAR